MYIGRFYGSRIKINFFFLLFMLCYAILGMLPEMVFLFLVVFLHESAHALVARQFQIEVPEIELFPFGGIARLEGLLELEPEVERRIAWAGPLMNFLLVGVALIFYNNHYYYGFFNEELILFFIRSNLTLAFFNLLPALPLDGGRILRSLLTEYCGYRQATEKATTLGKLLAVIIFLSGSLLVLNGFLNFSIPLVAAFLFFAAGREQSMAIYAFLRSLSAKDLEMERRGGMRGEQLVFLDDARISDVLRLFSPRKYHLVRILDHSSHVVGELSETALLEAALQKGIHVTLRKLI